MDAFPLRLSIRSIDNRSQERRVPLSADQGSKQTWPQSMRIYLNNWKDAACDRTCWRWTVKEVIERTDVKRHQKAEERDCRKNSSTTFFSRTATCAMVYTATQVVAAPPEIDKGAQAVSRDFGCQWWWWRWWWLWVWWCHLANQMLSKFKN